MIEQSRPYEGVYTALQGTYSAELIRQGIAVWAQNRTDEELIAQHRVMACVRSYCEAQCRETKQRADRQIARNNRADERYGAQAQDLRRRLEQVRQEVLSICNDASAILVEMNAQLLGEGALREYEQKCEILKEATR